MIDYGVCIGGALDGRRKPPHGRIMEGVANYRPEILDFGGNRIWLWVVEGMTLAEAMARVLHMYSERGQ